MTSGSSPFSTLSKLIIEAGLAALYLGALVFLAGWSFADRYFAELGLNISAIDGLETSSIYGYALWVFRDSVLILLAVAAVGCIVALGAIRRKAIVTEGQAVVLLIVLSLASLVGAGYLGNYRAERQVSQLLSEGYAAFSRVLVTPKTDSPVQAFLSSRTGFSENGCLRKLYMDRKNLYLYAGYKGQTEGRPRVLIIPLDEVAMIETLPITDLCN